MADMSIEELQTMCLDLKAKQEELETTNTALKSDLEKITAERDEARKLNAKLFRSGVSPETKQMEESGETEETVEQFIDSFLKPAKEALMKLYNIGE